MSDVLEGLTIVGLGLACVLLIGALGYLIASEDYRAERQEDRIERCVTNGGTAMVDRGSRVLCFNPQVVQEVK